MPTIVVYEKELRLGFLKNLEDAEQLLLSAKIASGLLLLFYSVECGLKYLLCVRRRGSHLAAGDGLEMTHNLNDLVKELRIAPLLLPSDFRLNRDLKRCPTRECHLAWRYGAKIYPEDERSLQLGLRQLAERIKEDIA